LLPVRNCRSVSVSVSNGRISVRAARSLTAGSAMACGTQIAVSVSAVAIKAWRTATSLACGVNSAGGRQSTPGAA
jgi:hypothetical protein